MVSKFRVSEHIDDMHGTALKRRPHAGHAAVGNERSVFEMGLDAFVLFRREAVTRGPAVDLAFSPEQPSICIAEPGGRFDKRIDDRLQLECSSADSLEHLTS